MQYSFRGLIAALITATSWTTCEVLYAASMHLRGSLYHSTLWLSRGWAIVALACVPITVHFVFCAWRNHEWDLPYVQRKS